MNMQEAPQPPQRHETDELEIERTTAYHPQAGDEHVMIWHNSEEGKELPEPPQAIAEGREEEQEKEDTTTTTAPAQEKTDAPVPATDRPRRHHRYWQKQKKKRPPLVLLAILIILLALLAGASAAVLLPAPLHAFITIAPRTATVTLSSELVIRPGIRESGIRTRTLAGRILPEMMLSEARTISTTGQGHEPAHPARGRLTFYNSLTLTQTIPVGTILTATGGQQVITEESAVIPAGTLSTNGEVSVPAHTLATGKSSTLAAYAIYGPCCRAYVQVANTVAFTGGTDTRTFQAVGKQDLAQATDMLKTHLDQSMQAGMQAQQTTGEKLLPLLCNAQTSSDYTAGQETRTVRVSVQETCQGVTVEQATWKHLSQALLDQEAEKWNVQYATIGGLDIQPGKLSISSDGQQARVQVRFAATYAYHFRRDEINQMRHLIAGKRVEVARTLLAQFPGMDQEGVDIEITGGRGEDTKSIPTDLSDIEIHDVFFGGPL